MQNLFFPKTITKIQYHIIQSYAPTNTADQEVKEEFYEQLQSVLERTPNRDITIVFGEVGNDNSTREIIMGKEGLGTMNENRELFSDFCEQDAAFCEIQKVIWFLPVSKQRTR